MRLDKYDARATAAVALAGALYVAHVADVGMFDVRFTALATLVAGVTSCAANGSRSPELPKGTYANVMTFFGVMVAVLGIAALVSGAEAMLVGELVVIAGLWLVTTVKHLCTEEPARVPDEQRALVSQR